MSELYDRLTDLVLEEYDRILPKAMEKYGRFTNPRVYIPKPFETWWREEFFPDGKGKSYGIVYSHPDGGTFFAINTWAYIRELESLGEKFVRDSLCRTLSHELIHSLKPGLSEIEVNIEGEKLLMFVLEKP